MRPDPREHRETLDAARAMTTSGRAREALDLARAKEAAPDESMSDEQLIGIITGAIASMPPALLDRVEEAVETKRHGPRLKVV